MPNLTVLSDGIFKVIFEFFENIFFYQLVLIYRFNLPFGWR